MELTLEKNSFVKRLKSMLKVDFRRMFTMPLIYIMIGICFVMPILILVMTTMMEGSVSVDPVTNEETVMEGFKNTWEIIGSVSSDSANSGAAQQTSMDIVSMCNINIIYFLIAVLVCIFVADDFRSGYCKNLFTVRSRKTDYVISKTAVCFIGGALMVFAFFIGAMIGGAISGLSFDLGSVSAYGVVMCIISKMILSLVFVSIYVLMSVIGKQKLWLSILLSLGIGMFLFNIAPMVSPLDSTVLNVILSLVGGTLLGTGMGAISNLILNKTSLI